MPDVQMGARPYVPGLGRFTSVDPIEGGCANDYVYVFGDPVNENDFSGAGLLGDLWDSTRCIFQEAVGGVISVVQAVRGDFTTATNSALGIAGAVYGGGLILKTAAVVSGSAVIAAAGKVAMVGGVIIAIGAVAYATIRCVDKAGRNRYGY